MTISTQARILQLMKSLPLADRIFMIDKPTLRKRIEKDMEGDLSEGLSKKEVLKKTTKQINDYRSKKI